MGWGSTSRMKGVIHSNIPLTAPFKVTGVSVTKTMESVTLTLRVAWTPPESDLTISQYQIRYRRNGTTVWDSYVNITGSPPPTFTNLTGLDADTEYDVQVRAFSEIGAGKWSVGQTVKTADSE